MAGSLEGGQALQDGEAYTWREDKTPIMLRRYLTCSVVVANGGRVCGPADCQTSSHPTALRCALTELRVRE